LVLSNLNVEPMRDAAVHTLETNENGKTEPESIQAAGVLTLSQRAGEFSVAQNKPTLFIPQGAHDCTESLEMLIARELTYCFALLQHRTTRHVNKSDAAFT
jgi:hypothetical protein